MVSAIARGVVGELGGGCAGVELGLPAVQAGGVVAEFGCKTRERRRATITVEDEVGRAVVAGGDGGLAQAREAHALGGAGETLGHGRVGDEIGLA
jgi:hypothetical protein